MWRLLLLWTGLMLLPTAIAAVPAWRLLSAGLDYSALELAHQLDATVLGDLASMSRKDLPGLGLAALLALLVTLLISPVLSAMALAAARAGAAPGFTGLLSAVRSFYLPMLRMLVWTLVLLALLALLAAGLARVDPRAAWLCVPLVLLVCLCADAGRAVLAAEPQRRSVLKAWGQGCKRLARRPLAMLGPYLLVSSVGAAVLALLGLGRLHLPGVNLAAFGAALLLTQLMVAVIGWTRCLRIIVLTRTIVKTAAAPT